MADVDHSPAISLDYYSSFTPVASIGVTVAGIRKVTFTHAIGGQPTELTCLTGTEGPPEIDMEKLSEIDGRLRTVENAVTRIETKLDHMPTTLQMWAAVAAVLIPVAGALWWVVQAYLGPILEKAAS